VSGSVYANKMEVSSKSMGGKSICAFPDVCFTPPLTPATPPGVPIPYPNTGMASDCTDGSSTVKISTKEIMLKNKSYFKKSTGDEAGNAPKKGVVTSTHGGKVYFNAWSMDVKVESENVVRHLDITTHNHNPPPGNSPPMAHLAGMSVAVKNACAGEIKKGKAACAGQTTKNCSKECKRSQKCLLVPKGQDKKVCCKPHSTGHHMIEDHWVKGNSDFPKAQGSFGYGAAPTVCANRFRKRGTVHRRLHDIQGTIEESHMPGGGRAGRNWDYGAGKKAALSAHAEVFGSSSCSEECMDAQLDSFYGKKKGRALNKPEKQALGGARTRLKSRYSGQTAGAI
jgi:hypothetical protein